MWRYKTVAMSTMVTANSILSTKVNAILTKTMLLMPKAMVKRV